MKRSPLLLLLSVALFASVLGAAPALPVEIPAEIQGKIEGAFESAKQAVIDFLTKSQDITLTIGSGKITCQVESTSSLKILEIYTAFIPDFARSVATVDFFDGADSPLNFEVDSFVIDFNTATFSLKSREWASIVFVNGFLDLDKVVVDFTIKYDASVQLLRRFTLASFVVTGVWKIGTSSVNFRATKDGTTYTVTGSTPTGDVNIGSLFQQLGEALLPTGGLETALKSAGLDKFVLKKVVVKAFYDRRAKDFALCFSGDPTIAGWNGFRLNVLFHYLSGGAVKVTTLGIEFKSFRLANLIKTISGLDVSSVPLLGSVTVPEVGVVISTALLDKNLIPDCFGPLLTASAPYPRGVSLNTHFELGSSGDDLSFVIRISSGQVVVEKSPKEVKSSFTLRNVAGSLGINVNSITLPPGISNVFNLAVTDFVYDVAKRELAITVSLGDSFDVIPGWVRIKKPVLDVKLMTSPRKVTVDAQGTWAIGPTTFIVDILPQNGGKSGYIFCGSGTLLKIGEILSFVASTFFPPGVNIGFLKSFEIANPSVCIPLGEVAKTREMSLTGEPRFSGFGGVTLNVFSKKIGSKTGVALGIDFANTKFADVIKKLTGRSIGAIRVIDQGLKLGVIVSSADFPGVKLKGQTLSQIGDIKKGLTIVGVFNLPACGTDPICKLLKPIVGGRSLQLKASFANLKSFTVSAAVANIRLGSGVTLESAGLELEVTTTGAPSFGIACVLAINNPNLRFKGAFRAMPTGELEAELSMVGIWQRAFGINWLAFGNVIMAIKFIPGVSVTAFELGGEVHIGTGRNKLIAKAYIGVDSTNSINNYFYASVNKLTIGSVMNAFGVSVRLIRPIQESGFPDGLEVSYAGMDKTVAGINIPKGFKLKGTINILGFRLKSDIHISPPDFIKVYIEMTPLSLAGGIFKMYSHPNNKRRGPYLKADISRSPPKVNLQASGYIELFGFIKMGATLKITNSEYIMEIRAPFFGVFQAYLRVHATYGSLKGASFKVHGELSTAWLNDLANKVKNLIKNGADAATAKIRAAQNKVTAAEAPIRRAQAKLNNARGKVNRLCSIRSCSSVCVGCPGWNRCCWKVWGSCKGCPGWNKCCVRVPNPICVAANVACKAVRAVAYAALWAAEKALNVARAPFFAARAILEGVKKAVKLGAAAASWIISHALTGLISIKKIWFDAAISAVNGGSVGGGIEVSFLKSRPIRFRFSLTFKNPFIMVKKLAENIWNKLKGRRRRDVESYIPGSYQVKGRDVRGIMPGQPISTAAPSEAPPQDDSPPGEQLRKEASDISANIDEAIKKEDVEARPHGEGGDFDPSLIPDDDQTDTNEGKCRRFKRLFEFLRIVLTGTDKVYGGLAQAIRPYAAQRSELANCREITDNARKESAALKEDAKGSAEDVKKTRGEGKEARETDDEDVDDVVNEGSEESGKDIDEADKVCTAVENLKTKARELIVADNAQGNRFILDDLDRSINRRFGKSLTQFVEDTCSSVEEMYENVDSDNARRVKRLVARICLHFGSNGDAANMTVLKSRALFKKIKSEVDEADAIAVFCSGGSSDEN